VANYRITITDAQATVRDYIKLVCTIQKENDVGGWDDLQGGPSSVNLQTSEALTVLRRQDLTDGEKRAALLEQMRTAARGFPIIAGDVAVDQIEALLPGGWPVTVGL
jgi:type II secretory pathway component PulC